MFNRTCKQCNTVFSVKLKSDKKIFCTRSCAAVYNNTGSKQSIETKEKISKSIKAIRPRIIGRTKYMNTCSQCNSIFKTHFKHTQTCSRMCYSLLMSKKKSLWLSTNRSHIKGPTKRSWMEESFVKWLKINYNGRWYEQVYFWNEEQRKNGWADFVFPKLKLIIELDGSHHKKREHLDKIRDEYLTRVRGYEVIRITHKEYRSKKRIPEILARLRGFEPLFSAPFTDNSLEDCLG